MRPVVPVVPVLYMETPSTPSTLLFIRRWLTLGTITKSRTASG